MTTREPYAISDPHTLGELTDPQPPSRPGGTVSMHDVASAFHHARKAHGLGKYDSLLTTHNGRDAIVDRIQEHADGMVYLIQQQLEQRALVEALELFRLRLVEDFVRRTPEAQPVLDTFNALLTPDALARRADAMAHELAEDAGAAAFPRGNGPAALRELEADLRASANADGSTVPVDTDVLEGWADEIRAVRPRTLSELADGGAVSDAARQRPGVTS